MKYLVVIPARGGSKGIPKKNIKPLNGKPLIYYTVEAARTFAKDEDICVTTDNEEIIQTVEGIGLKIPFKRPDHLATDYIGTHDVVIHALDHYENVGIKYDCVILLQPTSPFRKGKHIQEALKLYHKNLDMVVSVKEASANPYYVLFEENEQGYLKSSKKIDTIDRRQDAPNVYELNGAIYIYNSVSLRKYKRMTDAPKVLKYLMEELDSVDLDTLLDWEFAEYLIQKDIVNLNECQI